MRSSEVLQRVKEKLDELGVPKHICDVRRVPSRVRVQLFVRNSLWSLEFRKGITPAEFESRLSQLVNTWEHACSKEQVDLEDAIKAQK